MQHIVTPYALETFAFAWWDNAFTEDELNWLQERALNATEQANVGLKSSGDKEDLSKIRRSKVSWLAKTQEVAWVFEKLSHVVSALNAEFYRFDLTGFAESLQLTNYDHADKGMYGWHQDYGAIRKPSRKLSLVLQLTDPSSYEGGNLQILTNSAVSNATINSRGCADPVNMRKERGLIVVFPSYVLHQVTPVTQGTRQSLVTWVTGPEFK